MIRTRLAFLVLAAGLSVLSGCCWYPGRFLCGPRCCHNGVDAGASPITDGPILIPPTNGSDNLPLAPVPRQVPTPHAQVMPYTP